jgi:hypothetical protein
LAEDVINCGKVDAEHVARLCVERRLVLHAVEERAQLLERRQHRRHGLVLHLADRLLLLAGRVCVDREGVGELVGQAQ